MHLEFMLLDLFCLCVQKMRDLMLALSALNFAFTVILISGLKTKVSFFLSRLAKIDFTSAKYQGKVQVNPRGGWGYCHIWTI